MQCCQETIVSFELNIELMLYGDWQRAEFVWLIGGLNWSTRGLYSLAHYNNWSTVAAITTQSWLIMIRFTDSDGNNTVPILLRSVLFLGFFPFEHYTALELFHYMCLFLIQIVYKRLHILWFAWALPCKYFLKQQTNCWFWLVYQTFDFNH